MSQTLSTSVRFLANALSVLLHPVFMPLYCCFMLYGLLPETFAGIPFKQVAGWLGMMVINTILFPLLLLALLKGLGFIKSILLKDTKERVIPLIGVMVFYFWPYLVAKNVHAPEAARILLLGNFWGIIAVFMCTIFFKISMHSSAAGSALGFGIVLCILNGTFLALALVLPLLAAALIIWARRSLGAHSWRELWLGFGLGIAAQLGALLYLH